MKEKFTIAIGILIPIVISFCVLIFIIKPLHIFQGSILETYILQKLVDIFVTMTLACLILYFELIIIKILAIKHKFLKNILTCLRQSTN